MVPPVILHMLTIALDPKHPNPSIPWEVVLKLPHNLNTNIVTVIKIDN